VKLAGSGLDVSLYVTNPSSALDMPEELSAIMDLARKPVRRIAEERRAEAAARREKVFTLILDALSCVMFADGKASKSERKTIWQLMQRIRAPWDESEVDQRLRDFRNRAVRDGLDTIAEDVCSRMSLIQVPRQQEALRKCLEHVVSADEEIAPKETAMKQRFFNALKNGAAATS